MKYSSLCTTLSGVYNFLPNNKQALNSYILKKNLWLRNFGIHCSLLKNFKAKSFMLTWGVGYPEDDDSSNMKIQI